MRILTVRQPYAGLIAAEIKPVENRTRNVAGKYRGPVAIHCAKSLAAVADDPRFPWVALHRAVGFGTRFTGSLGAILCVVDLVDVHRGISEDGSEICYCSPWAQIENWHLILDDPRPLTEPLTHWADGTPIKGALGLRTLNAEQEQWILDHLEVTR